MEPYFKTFVSVGNCHYPFNRLLELIKQNVALLPRPILIQRGHTEFSIPDAEVVDFIDMDHFVVTMAKSQIQILHAGAGSLLQALQAGKKPIVMARELQFAEQINDHQLELANAFHQLDKVTRINNSSELAIAIQHCLAQANSPYLPREKKSRAVERIKQDLVAFLA